MKAFGYCRVSGLGQVQGDGIPRQKLAIQEYATAHSLEIAGWYDELGVTGKADSDDRPALRQLLADLNGCRTVIVERLDRLARDLIVQEGILSKFKANGVELISTAEPDLCSEDPTRIFIRQVLGAVAQLDRSLIVRKLKAARDRIKAEHGRCEGQKPYGLLEGEAETLSMMRVMDARGDNAEFIASALSHQGHKTRSGKPWRGSVVRKILARAQPCTATSPNSLISGNQNRPQGT